MLLDAAGTGAEIGATMNVLWFQVLLLLEFYWSSTTGAGVCGRLLWFLVCTVLAVIICYFVGC